MTTVSVPYTFQTATATIPLSNLDANFAALVAAYNGTGQVATTIAGLRAVSKANATNVAVTGYYAQGDGGGGLYYYNASDTTSADNGGTIIVASDGGRWYLVTNGIVSPQQFGAVGNGSTDNAAALTNLNAASAVTAIRISTGNLAIASNVTFTKPVTMEGSATFVVPTGVTLAFNGGFQAPLSQVFTLTGTAAVTFAAGKLHEGYPEWWGAIPGNTGTDCQPGISAAIVACPKVKLQSATYYINSAVQLTTSNRTLEGTNPGSQMFGVAGGTQLAIQSATADALFVGLAADPGSIGAFLQGVVVRDIGTYRTLAVTPPTAGNEIPGSASGLRINYVLSSIFENVYTTNNSIGFNLINVVDTKLFRCVSARTVNGNSATNDIYYAFSLDGLSTYRMESVYLIQCTSTANPAAQSTKTGVSAPGTFTDTQILSCEFDGCDYGIFLNGTGASTASIDNVIFGNVLDQCGTIGIYIENQPNGSSIKVTNNYVLCKTTATACYSLSNNQFGAISLIGNEGIGFSTGTEYGLYVSQCTNVSTVGNNWVNLYNPVYLTSVTSCKIADNIINLSVTATTAAVQLAASCANCVIDSIINAAATNKFPIGVDLVGTSNINNEIRLSGMDLSGVTTQLTYNGSAITQTGLFGTNNIALGNGNQGKGSGSKYVNQAKTLGTTYTNSSGAPLIVSVLGTSTATALFEATVDGLVTVYGGIGTAGQPLGVFFEVPAGSTYSVAPSAGTGSVSNWFEW